MTTLNWSSSIIGPLTWVFMVKSTILLLGNWLVNLISNNIHHPEKSQEGNVAECDWDILSPSIYLATVEEQVQSCK